MLPNPEETEADSGELRINVRNLGKILLAWWETL